MFIKHRRTILLAATFGAIAQYVFIVAVAYLRTVPVFVAVNSPVPAQLLNSWPPGVSGRPTNFLDLIPFSSKTNCPIGFGETDIHKIKCRLLASSFMPPHLYSVEVLSATSATARAKASSNRSKVYQVRKHGRQWRLESTAFVAEDEIRPVSPIAIP